MKIKANFDAITITSALTADQMAKAAKYAPQSTTLFDDKKPVFAVATGKAGSINSNGVVFDGVAADGTLYATIPVAGLGKMTAADAKAKLENDYGMALFNLKKVEEQVVAAVGAAAEAIATVADSIEIG